MNLYHIKLTDHQKAALEHLFSLDIAWNKTELEKAWGELREQLKESVQCVAIINAVRDSGCNCKKPTETAPKYDPCRDFREGDRVRVRKIHGNLPQCRYNGMVKVKEGDCCTIHSKEHRNCYWVTIPSGAHYCFDIAYFELITPVEELAPYRIFDNKRLAAWTLLENELIFTYYPYRVNASDNIAHTKEQAKAAAEAERDRLNAEHRKEQA